MADRGHELTDELLKDLEKRVAEEYGTALREMEKKVREYFEALDAQDAVQRQLLEDGKITQQDYNDWRYRHTMIGKRWEALRDGLAEDMHHTNEIAYGIARSGMANVCALNHNYAVYQVEHDGELDTGLAMYNDDTAAYLLAQERETMPGPSTKKAAEIAANKDLQWNRQKIQSALFQGIMLGDSPYDIARRLQGVAQMNYNAAVRYARTMTTNAQNAGRYEAFREATDLGVELTIEWAATLDNRTRHDHRMMHGQRRAVNEPFITPDGFYILWPAQTKYGSSDVPQRMIWNCRCTLLSWVNGFEPGTVTSSPKMGDMTFEEWLYAKPMTRQQQDDWIRAGKPDVKEWKWKDIHRMAANASTDREQFERYSLRLGSLAPKDLASFLRIKYTDKDGWTDLKREYRLSGILQKGISTRISRSGEVLNPMPQEEYARIKAALERNGKTIRPVLPTDPGDDYRYMVYGGIEASYMNGEIRHLGLIPSRGTLYEEIIHMAQERRYGPSGADEAEICAREIEAARKLLAYKDAYRLDEADISAIETNLVYWEGRFARWEGQSYDESNYRG